MCIYIFICKKTRRPTFSDDYMHKTVVVLFSSSGRGSKYSLENNISEFMTPEIGLYKSHI